MKPRQSRRLAPLGSSFTTLPAAHGFLVAAMTQTFQRLRIAATLLDSANEWHAIHAERMITAFEFAHARGSERSVYNDRCIAKVRREGRTLRAEHAGFSDFFVPVGSVGILITGPFSVRRPSSAEARARWRSLSGREGHLEDPEFSHYLISTLATPVFEGESLADYQRWLEIMALAITGSGDVTALRDEVAVLNPKLAEIAYPEGMWEATRQILDERTVSIWKSPALGDDLLRMGIERLPEDVAIGLIASPDGEHDLVDALFRKDAFRRECVDLALEHGSICGLAGDHGVSFLRTSQRSVKHRTERLVELAERARRLARAHRLTLHVGIGNGTSLGARYEQALGAAELALSRGLAIVHAEPGARRHVSRSHELWRELAGAQALEPAAVLAKVDRYLQSVAVQSGYRLEHARPHLAGAFDLAGEILLGKGVLPERARGELFESVARADRKANNFGELRTVYRQALADLVHMAREPVSAARDRSLRRAMDYVKEHLAERLSLSAVARAAGFSRNYFSQLFKKQERMTFESYVRQLRIERSKELLMTTELSTERVGQLSGFASREYFHRVFKVLVGSTPAQYRSSRPVSRHRAARR